MTRSGMMRATLAVAVGGWFASVLGAQGPPPILTGARGFFHSETELPNAPSVTAGVPGFHMQITGSNFTGGLSVPSPQVTWYPSTGPCPIQVCVFSSSLLSSTEIRVNLPEALIASPDPAARITVSNFNSTESNFLTFPVNPPITPSSTVPNGNIGVPYSAVLFTGGTGPYSNFIEAGQLPPGLVLGTNNLLTGTPTTAGTYSALLIYNDTWGTFGSANVNITITAPSLSFTPAVLATGQVGTAYSETLVGSGGVAPYTFTVSPGTLPPGLTLSSTGLINGNPTSPGTYNLTISMQDAAGNPGSGTRSITINPAPVVLTFTPATLPNGRIGQSYDVTLQGAGGTGPYSFVQTGGSLPSGLTFESTGRLSGTPSTSGTFSFTVRVTDSLQRNGTGSLSVTIGPALGIVFFTPTTLATATVGVPYSRSLTGGGGTAPYTFSVVSGSVPAGLAFTSAGLVSGTPLVAGSYAMVVRVTDADGATSTATLTIAIASGLQILTTSLPQVFPSVTYFGQLQAVGGQPPYTWLIQSGSLPAGLVLNTGSGLISGTPDVEASTSSVTITVRDSAGNTAQRTVDLVMGVRPPQVTSTELPSGNVGTGYSFVLTATGGSGTMTWLLESGVLPPGFVLSPTGVLAGVPTAAGDFTFSLRVFDNGGRFGVAAVHLLINPPLLTITTEALPAWTTGAVNISFSANGGTPPYAWSVGNGTLPSGLTLSSSGVLSGVTNAAGSFDFRIVVTDGKRSNAGRNFRLVLTVPPLAVGVRSLPGGTVGASYSVTLAGTGGLPPYRWSVSGLPGGLGLGQDGTTISGTPTADGSYRISLQVTDSTGVSASSALTLEIAPPPLVISTRSIPAAVAGVPYSFTFVAAAGSPPYNWLVTGSIPPGLRMSSDGTLSGTPTAGGSSEFSVIVSDTRGSLVRQTFTLVVQIRPVAITTQGLPGGTVGQPYSQSLAATGGIPPYAWSGTLPAGLAIDAASGAISGTPSAAGTGAFAITVTDANRTTATANFLVNFALPAPPALTISGPPDTVAALQQSNLQLSFGTTFPVAVSGTVTLSFRGDTGADDGAVQFSLGGRTASFTIPANSTQAVFGAPTLGIQNGTTAGLITLTVRLFAGNVDITPNPAPVRQVRVSPGPPVITSVRATRTATGLEVQVVGYSSTRELTQGQFRFTASPGAALQTTDLTVPVDAIFAVWYGSTASVATGALFTYTQPFTVQGPAGLQSVSVMLSNRLGASTAVTAAVQ